ncbi:THUMP domain-containing protein 1 [Chlorella vulgaris]
MQGGRDGKRARQDGGGNRANNKKRYLHKAPASGGKSGIPQSSRGIIVSCTSSKENLAGKEAMALFTESYEQLGGTWKQQGGAGAGADPAEGEAAAVPTDIAAALASEVAELRDPSRRPFYFHQVGMHSVVYVECKDAEGPSPAALAQHACQRVADSHQSETRFCSRFYPVEHTCYASMEKIEELAEQVSARHFPADAEQPIQYAVAFDARAAPPLDRMAVIDAFASRVPAPHKVNLGAPQKTILVNLVKAVCGVAVVDRFKELCRYNVRTLALSEEEREAQRQEQRTQTKQQQAAAAAEQPEQTEQTEQPAAAAVAAGQQEAAAPQQQQQLQDDEQQGAAEPVAQAAAEVVQAVAEPAQAP